MVLTRSQIARTLSDEIGLTRKNSAEVINAFTRAITKALEGGEDVRIRNFGRFKVISDGGRRRNGFSRDESLPRTARKVVRFKGSKILKACLQGEAGACEDLSGVNAIIEHLQKNLEISDKLQNVLDAHCRWAESEGSKGKRANLARFDMRGADLFGYQFEVSEPFEGESGQRGFERLRPRKRRSRECRSKRGEPGLGQYQGCQPEGRLSH